MRREHVAVLIAVILPLAFADPPGNAGQGAQNAGQGDQNAGQGTRNVSQVPQKPRGDDPRSRSWGAPGNDLGESKFDDRKSPRTVSFLGRSPNVRIYPNYSDPGVYLQLRFGKVQELDRSGRPVAGHSVPSFAEATNLTFAAGNTTVNGVNMSYVNVSLNPLTRNDFRLACSASSGSGDRRLLSRRALLGSSSTLTSGTGAAPQVNISLFFGLDDALTIPYGDVNITLPRNGLKWTVSYANWPFCNTSNTLSVSLNLLIANNGSAQVASGSANNGTQQLNIVLGASYNATLSFLDYAIDGAAAAATTAAGNGSAAAANAIRMPVNVTLAQDGGVTTVAMRLPNPAAYNVSSGAVWYDPTQTTTSAYLSADDPGNAAVTVTASVQSSSDGAAAALRVGVWTAAAAVLLSAFSLGAVPHLV